MTTDSTGMVQRVLLLSQRVVDLDFNFAIDPPRRHPNECFVNVAYGQWPHLLVSYLVRSFTIKSGAAPDATISSRVCEVHTASVGAPAARPAINPDGASSTTRPAAMRSYSAVVTGPALRQSGTYSSSGPHRRVRHQRGMGLAAACPA
jgi:hypothetical protein